MRRNFRIVVEYDGAEFHGWQVQPDRRTVQGEIEKAVETVAREKTKVLGAGRTDAGVHAMGQVANFHLEHSPIEAGKLHGGVNALTGDDVAVLSLEEAPDSFCARTNVVSKTYRYRILSSRVPSPLRRRTHLLVTQPLDVGEMRRAASMLEGEHDFSAFRASDCSDPNPVRTIRRCAVEQSGSEIFIDVTAKGFLKNMVRIMAGTLLAAGKKKLPAGDIPEIIESRDRRKAGPTAPAHGLVLVKIVYAERNSGPGAG